MDRRQDQVVLVQKRGISLVARRIRRVQGELRQKTFSGRVPRRDLLQLVQVSPADLCIRMKSLEVGLVPTPRFGPSARLVRTSPLAPCANSSGQRASSGL